MKQVQTRGVKVVTSQKQKKRKRRSLIRRLTWSLALLSTVVTGGMFLLVAKFYFGEMAESQETVAVERVRAVALRARGFVEPAVLSFQSQTGDFLPTVDPEQLKIPRVPSGRETFVGVSEGRQVLLFSAAKKGFVMVPWSPPGVPWKASDVPTFWFTAQGVYLGGNQGQEGEKGFFEKKSVRAYMKSVVSHGVFRTRSGGASLLVAYAEVPSSNIVIMTEQLDPFSDLIFSKYFLAAALLFVVGLGVMVVGTLLIVRTALRPLSGLLRTSSHLFHGLADQEWHYGFEDEIFDLFSQFRKAALTIRHQEARVANLQAGLSHLLVGTRDMALAPDRFTASAIAASMVRTNVEFKSPCSAWAYLLPVSAHSDPDASHASTGFLQAQVLARDLPESGDLVLGPCVHFSNPEEVLSRKRSYVDEGTQLLVVLVALQGEAHGFLVFEGLGRALTPDELSVLDTIAASLWIALQAITLMETVRKKARLESELCAVKTVQENLLPLRLEFPGLDIASYYHPAELAGGDWYGCYFDEREQIFYAYLGDVTGHGIPAALMTGVAFGAARAAEQALHGEQVSGGDPLQRLMRCAEYVNGAIESAGKGRYLMTMVLVGLDVISGCLFVVNAGQLSPLWKNGAAGKVTSISVGGTVLGDRRPGEFGSRVVQLLPGETILLYSDGLVENEGEDGKTLSRRAVMRALGEGGEASAVLENILSAGQSVWRDHPAKDDVTMLLVRWLGP